MPDNSSISVLHVICLLTLPLPSGVLGSSACADPSCGLSLLLHCHLVDSSTSSEFIMVPSLRRHHVSHMVALRGIGAFPLQHRLHNDHPGLLALGTDAPSMHSHSRISMLQVICTTVQIRAIRCILYENFAQGYDTNERNEQIQHEKLSSDACYTLKLKHVTNITSQNTFVHKIRCRFPRASK